MPKLFKLIGSNRFQRCSLLYALRQRVLFGHPFILRHAPLTHCLQNFTPENKSESAGSGMHALASAASPGDLPPNLWPPISSQSMQWHCPELAV